MPTKLSDPTVSVDLALILIKYAEKIGLDVKQLCERVELGHWMKSQTQTRVSIKRFNALWQKLFRESGDDFFGLRLGEFFHDHIGGHLVFMVMMNCPTVGEALDKYCRYHGLMADIIQPRLIRERESSAIHLETTHPSIRLERHHVEFVFSGFSRLLRRLTDDRVTLEKVCFRQAGPSDAAEHRRFFRAVVQFEQSRNALVFNSRWLSAPVFLANPELLEAIEPLAVKLIQGSYPTEVWTDKAARFLTAELMRGKKPGLDAAARYLAVSPRLLQNRLKLEGTSYQQILDRVRKNIAIKYLETPDESICDIAFLLGFSEQSGFTHAFKRWTGLTPRDYRLKKSGNKL